MKKKIQTPKVKESDICPFIFHSANVRIKLIFRILFIFNMANVAYVPV